MHNFKQLLNYILYRVVQNIGPIAVALCEKPNYMYIGCPLIVFQRNLIVILRQLQHCYKCIAVQQKYFFAGGKILTFGWQGYGNSSLSTKSENISARSPKMTNFCSKYTVGWKLKFRLAQISSNVSRTQPYNFFCSPVHLS